MQKYVNIIFHPTVWRKGDNLTTMECAIDESQSEQHQILTPTNEPETEIEKLKRLLNESQEKVKQMESKCGQLEQLLKVKTNDLDVKTKDLEAMKKINKANLEDIDKNRRAEQRTATILNSIFTPGQITKLFAENRKRITWSAEDISSAIALRSLSGRTYKYLREVKQMPLPCESTLRNWAAWAVEGCFKDNALKGRKLNRC
ncbi:uncharacterized protein LOC113005171 [Solenopsis invicta]|uniref:uncharacterized protein LOC113005171 n=1 Tax=Solenopsis invicta TaxID=13686 RepID=UPI00193C9EF0|nr:uncharacterized protein LOC113005171 [Solenopsis invicta]